MEFRSIDRRRFVKNTLVGGSALLGLTASEGPLSGQPGTGVQRVPRKKLGSTGVEVPILGMGGSQKFEAQYDKRLHRALAVGINYFDSSERYSNGQSHKTLATFFEQVGDRKKVWITSKVSHGTHPAKKEAPPEHFEKNLEQVLQDLRTDYLDMFFMHGLDDERFLEPEFIQMSERLKKKGKINFFGFSCHADNVPELITKAARVGGIDAIMFRYSFRTYGDLKMNKAIDAAKKAGIGLLAMKTMASVPSEEENSVQTRFEKFTLPQAKLKSIWADERIDVCVSEMENIQMVMENSQAAISTVPLTAADLHQLNRLAAQTASLHCNGCSRYCETSAGGNLRIADTMRYLMYEECYGDPDKGKEGYRSLSEEERSYESADLESAARACPQGIDIAARLKKARDTFSS